MLTRMSCVVQRAPFGLVTGSKISVLSASAQPAALVGTPSRPYAAFHARAVPGVKPSTAVIFSCVHTFLSSFGHRLVSRMLSMVWRLESGKVRLGIRPSSNPGYICVITSCWIAPPDPPLPMKNFGTP